MKVELAGFNTDISLIGKDTTPETFSAAYAKISRDPRDVGELRKEALKDIEKTRKTNDRIVFGLGHSSVAEHAFFNFDIIGLSRLATEEVQSFRLASFTEKSQRYITIESEKEYPEQFKNYNLLYEGLKECLFAKYGESVTVDGWAKEDARYALPLGVKTQFGMSLNARSLEYMIKKLRASMLEENRELAEQLYASIKNISPSIIKYTIPNRYDKTHTNSSITESYLWSNEDFEAVKLINHTPNPDEIISSLYESFEGEGSLLIGKEAWQPAPREYEFVDFTFELNISHSCFAQLKRHRMASILQRENNTGIIIPPNIKEIGMESVLIDSARLAKDMYTRTNAHVKKVFFKSNLRALYHFMSLRLDKHAQWEIRKIAELMRREIQKVAPIFGAKLKGKEEV